jgi:crotonobetainyl-CoA:carnitine CoA-transferase CaiB-like acyl-CoA transferase
MFQTVQHPIRGPVTIPAWPVKMSESCVPATASPLLGQHNQEVYGELLGCSPQDVAALKADTAI